MLSARELEARRLTYAADWEALGDLCASNEDALGSPVLAYARAEALYHTGRMKDLGEYAGLYEESARETGDVVGQMRALNVGGIAAFELGQMAVAGHRFDRLMGVAESEGHTDMLARAANNLGAIANLRGHFHEALAYYRLAIPLYQSVGQRRGLAQTHHNMGLSHRDLSEYEDAIDAFDRAAAIGREISYPPIVGMSLNSRAEVMLASGDGSLAHALADRAFDIATEMGDEISRGDALRVRGAARAALGDRDGAGSDMKGALDIARATGNDLLEAEVLRDDGLLVREVGDPERADSLRRAIAVFRSLGAEASVRALASELGEEVES